MTKIKERICIETIAFVQSPIPKKYDKICGIKRTSYPYVHAPNPQPISNELISGQLVINNSNNKYVFSAINVSNNFATITTMHISFPSLKKPGFPFNDRTRIRYFPYFM